MMEYKRLTERMSDGKGNPNCSECEHNKMCGDEYYCDDDESCYQKIFDRLAELEDKIENGTLKEEKTCKNVSEMHPVDGFTCSECGISLVDYVEERVDEEESDVTYHEYEIKYCPNCGAKVVEE